MRFSRTLLTLALAGLFAGCAEEGPSAVALTEPEDESTAAAVLVTPTNAESPEPDFEFINLTTSAEFTGAGPYSSGKGGVFETPPGTVAAMDLVLTWDSPFPTGERLAFKLFDGNPFDGGKVILEGAGPSPLRAEVGEQMLVRVAGRTLGVWLDHEQTGASIKQTVEVRAELVYLAGTVRE